MDEASFDESLDDSIGSTESLPIGVDLSRTYAVGQRVEAQFARKAKFYKGTITKVLPTGRYNITYIDGDKEASVHGRYIRLDPRVIGCAGDMARDLINNMMEKYKPAPKEPVKPKVITVAVLGLDGAGKTSFLNALQGEAGAKVRPTVGFKPLSMMLDETLQIKFYDLGGGKKIRGIWDKYYDDVHACMYVVDSTTAIGERAEEEAGVFKQTLGSAGLGGKPLCLVCNKQDEAAAAAPLDVAKALGVTEGPSIRVQGTISNVADDSVEKAVEWVLDTVKKRYTELNTRVEKEIARRKKEEQAKKLARERKVLRNKVACAFPSKVTNTDLLPVGVTAETEPEDCFSEEEGTTFLASEVGLESLPEDAATVCALVGYQRLALTIIGGLFAPVSKKKEPLSWAEILELVNGVRGELGIA